MDCVDLPQKNEVKDMDVHLDRKLAYAKHIKTKRQELNQKVKQMHWLLGRSTLSVGSTLLYKAVFKLIWTCGIQLWGTASNSNIETLQRFQSKTLRYILNTP
jgi:hypothetical protein